MLHNINDETNDRTELQRLLTFVLLLHRQVDLVDTGLDVVPRQVVAALLGSRRLQTHQLVHVPAGGRQGAQVSVARGVHKYLHFLLLTLEKQKNGVLKVFKRNKLRQDTIMADCSELLQFG